MEDGQAPDAPCQCRPAKSAGAGRSRPVEGTITAFREEYGISEDQWEAGELSRKSITELPPKLQFPPKLTELDLNFNQIVDVSGLTLPEGLTRLDFEPQSDRGREWADPAGGADVFRFERHPDRG